MTLGFTDFLQAEMLKIGCPMAVKHNEVAPGQHEMSPVFRAANVSCDSNVCFMEVMNREAAKLGLQVLFHEKPFAGINGSGKHANWSVGTDTGLNFFYPGKNEAGAKLYVTAIACLSYGLAQYLGCPHLFELWRVMPIPSSHSDSFRRSLSAIVT